MAPPIPEGLCISLLHDKHDRIGFTCGVAALDLYLRTQAGQDVRRRANGIFVATSVDQPSRILGYYALCALALPPGEVPDAARRHLPRYPLVSATLISRLAVASGCQGQGIGALILADALGRSWRAAQTIGSSMVVVDALDDRASAFYAAHGFVRLPDSRRLMLPMRTIAGMIVE